MVDLQVNYLAVLVCGVVSFVLGGLWYSPLLFAKKWVALLGKTQEELQKASNPMMYVIGFITGLISCFAISCVVNAAGATTLVNGALIGFLCWLGFAGATSYNNQVNFVGKPPSLWAIDSGYNLASFIIAGAILAVWK
jgi:uncharacterized membrane protein